MHQQTALMLNQADISSAIFQSAKEIKNMNTTFGVVIHTMQYPVKRHRMHYNQNWIDK